MTGRVRALLGRLLRPRPATPPARPLPPPPVLGDEIGVGAAGEAWLQTRRSARHLYSSLTDERLRALASAHPDLEAATIAAAERAIAHEFDLLGSGPFVPADPGRPGRAGYRPIDWYLDPVQKLRFPERIPLQDWNLLEMRPGLADIKFPWELSRCQHWLPLAQAFRMTGEMRYADEILNQLDDFMDANPVGLGVNWTCTMDVALRALNWAMAIELIQADARVDHSRLAHAYGALFDHGHFIERNLENKYEVTSNHFLSNVVGMFGLAAFFGDVPSARRWSDSCRGWLEQEMAVQVLDDGADYESSVPYHRLVAELFLAALRIADTAGTPLSETYRHKLRAMMEFLWSVMRPDGKVPQVGDADDGRVHILSDYGRWNPQDARHLLAPAAIEFGEARWWRRDDPWASWEAAWWGLDPAPVASSSSRDVARLFPSAGIAVVRNDRDYLLITNGVVGTNGFGNHKHNDLLSFEFHQHGTPLFLDPGSFVYTSNPDARNYFRSTAAHNTLTVDNEEQNEFKAEWLFRMFAKAVPEHLEFTESAGSARYRGRHNGYERLPEPVGHERGFTLDRASGTLTIHDRLSGRGQHALCWRFQCAPGVAATLEHGQPRLRANGREWTLRADRGLAASIESGWYSPSYGVREPAPVLQFRASTSLTAESAWTFSLEPQS